MVAAARQSRKTPQIPDQTAFALPEMIQFWIMYVHFDVNFLSDTAQYKYLKQKSIIHDSPGSMEAPGKVPMTCESSQYPKYTD